MAKLSKYVKKHNGNLFRFLVKEDSTKLKKHGTSFHATFFAEFFDKNLSSVISHKLVKFYYQKIFTSQIIL